MSIKNVVEVISNFHYMKSNYLNPKIIPFHYFLLYFMVFIYLITNSHFFNNVIILIVYSLGIIATFYKFNFIINKFRFIANFLIIIFIFSLILLLSNVSNASWVGITIVLILYCQLILNFILFYLEKKNKNIEFIDQLSERDQLEKIRNIKKGLTDDEASVEDEHYRDVF